MFRYFKMLFSIVILAIAPSFAGATIAQSPPGLLKKIWNNAKIDPDDFSKGFLKEVPQADLEEILAHHRSSYGPAIQVSPTKSKHTYLIETQGFTIQTEIRQNRAGRVTGLLFRYAHVKGLKHNDLLSLFEQQDTQLSYLLLQNGQVRAEHNSDARLAVGSAFKLYVLDQVQQQIKTGRISWRDKLILEQKHISHPSGTMQDERVGKKFVLRDVARNMIAISDNTATDMLMDLVGQESVVLPNAASPALTTKQFFHLKANEQAAQAYREAGADNRTQILAELPAELPPADKVMVPLIDGIEWYATAGELCEIIKKLRDIKGVFENPGVANPEHWKSIVYKGGSEIGVLNMTYALKDRNGNDWCFAVTWNSKQKLDEAYLIALVATLLESPASVKAALQ